MAGTVSRPVPRTLLLIPSVVSDRGESAGAADSRPQADYRALQAALQADILDYSALEAEAHPALVRLARVAGKDAALAALGYVLTSFGWRVFIARKRRQRLARGIAA